MTKQSQKKDTNLFEVNIFLQELSNAVSLMKQNKSSGLGGLTVEFYQKFWDPLSPFMLNCFTECIQKGKMSDTPQIVFFHCFLRKGDPGNLENWRPISPLNTDYKSLASV